MKNFTLLFLTSLFVFGFTVSALASVNLTFKKPYHGQDFKKGDDVYVLVEATNRHEVGYMKLFIKKSHEHYYDEVGIENDYPYEWGRVNGSGDSRLRNLSEGDYTIKAVAYDSQDRRLRERTISINVQGNSDPVHLTFKKPYHGQDFKKGDDVYVLVEATNRHEVGYMKLFIKKSHEHDYGEVGIENDYPYEWGRVNGSGDSRLRNLSEGDYTIKAVAYDSQDRRLNERTITIHVKHNNNAPIVSFESPRNAYHYQDGYSAHVKVNATDHDDYVNYVNLYINETHVGRDNHAPYEWYNYPELQNLAAGSYTLKAVAVDNYGLTTEKKIIFHVKHNNQAPTVSFEQPYSGQELKAGEDLLVKVNAHDSDDYVARVKLYINDNLVGDDDQAPYDWKYAPELKNLAVGTYILKAIAFDNFGKSSETTVHVNVTASSCQVDAWFAKPNDHAVFQEGEDVMVEVMVDNVQDVAKVDLSLEGQWISEDSDAPYVWGYGVQELSNLWEGEYELKAVITDVCGGKTEKYHYFKVENGNGGDDDKGCEAIVEEDFEDFDDGSAVIEDNGWVKIERTESGEIISDDNNNNILKIDNNTSETSALWAIDQDLVTNESFIISWDVYVPNNKRAICLIYSNPNQEDQINILAGVNYGGGSYDDYSFKTLDYVVDGENGEAILLIDGEKALEQEFEGVPGYMAFQSVPGENVEFYIDNVSIKPIDCYDGGNANNNTIEQRSFSNRKGNNSSVISLEEMTFTLNQDEQLISENVTSKLTATAFPNPFVERLNIAFNLEEATTATLDLMDANGRIIQRIQDDFYAGQNEVAFEGTTHLPNGMYFVRVNTAYSTITLPVSIAK